jgi:hypothetical protein
LNTSSGNISSGRERALQRCQELIEWYEKQKPKHRIESIVLAELSEWRERLLKEDTAASMRETIERLVAKAPPAAP